MYSLVKVFLQISLLRAGPQALPHSQVLLVGAIVLHWALGIALFASDAAPFEAMTAAALGTLLMLFTVRGVLLVRRLPHRFRQTATALAGAEFIVGLPALPLNLWYANQGPELLIGIAFIGLIIWNVLVAMHVFRHALETSPEKAVAIAIAYMLISYLVMGLLTGPGA